MTTIIRETANTIFSYTLNQDKVSVTSKNMEGHAWTYGLDTPRGQYILSLIARKPTNFQGLQINRETPRNRFVFELGSQRIRRFNKTTGQWSNVQVPSQTKDMIPYQRSTMVGLFTKGYAYAG